MHATALDPHRDDRPHEDHFIVLHGASWSDYQRILEIRGERPSRRIAYVEGRLEIGRTSLGREMIKSAIGRLVEEWCLEHEIEFTTVGSWTLEDKSADCGVEPDECYIFGQRHGATRPDLAIEVIWTSGGIDKLEIYRKLGVAEVWIWRRGELAPHVLRGENYEPATASEVLPGIDLRQIAGLLDQPTTSAAIRAYRELLQKR